MHKKPPMLISVRRTGSTMAKAQATGTPMAKAAKPAMPLVFRPVKKKDTKTGGSLSNLLYDMETARRARELHKSLTEAFPL